MNEEEIKLREETLRKEMQKLKYELTLSYHKMETEEGDKLVADLKNKYRLLKIEREKLSEAKLNSKKEDIYE